MVSISLGTCPSKFHSRLPIQLGGLSSLLPSTAQTSSEELLSEDMETSICLLKVESIREK